MGALKDQGVYLHEVPRVRYQDAFLIGDLLTTRITMLTGEPKAGKSLLAAGMVKALVNGEERFLGQPVHRQLERVVFGLTDDGADEELRERLTGTVDEKRIRVFPVTETENPRFWPEVTVDLLDWKPDLFVLDNVLGSLAPNEDIASSPTGTGVIRHLRPISRAGIPVLAITHTPKGTSEGLTVASSVIGSRAIAGGARGVIALRRSKKDGLMLETAINRAKNDLSLRVEVRPAGTDSEVPVWSVRERKQHADRRRNPETLDRAAQVARRILAEQPPPMSDRELGRRYADEVGCSADALRKRLPKMIRHDGTQWVMDSPGD